jgi:hypothetical protein
VLLVGEGLLLINVKLISGSDLLVLTGGELGGGVSEDVGGILNLGVSEGMFRSTLVLLSSIDLVVVDLFGVNGITEIGEDIEDGIEG